MSNESLLALIAEDLEAHVECLPTLPWRDDPRIVALYSQLLEAVLNIRSMIGNEGRDYSLLAHNWRLRDENLKLAKQHARFRDLCLAASKQVTSSLLKSQLKEVCK